MKNTDLSQNKFTLVATRYAQALMELSKTGEITKEGILENLKSVSDILKSSPDLSEVLINPVVGIDDKKEIIEKVFNNEIHSLIKSFMMLLVEKDRFFAFKYIVYAYEKELDKENNLSRVSFVSAVPLGDDVKERLKNKLKSKLKTLVSCTWEVDPQIIAGLIIKIEDNIIDNSVRHKLEELRNNITR